jgi:uncharacterized damage-inducible protein DinB
MTTPDHGSTPDAILTPAQLLEHWQGHRRLTRRTISVYPEEHLFTFSPVAPLRPFSALALEMIGMVAPVVRGVATGEWTWSRDPNPPATKAALLEAWDGATATLETLWPRVTAARLREVEPERLYDGPTISHLARVLYLLDNEVHHRGQGFVYLRLLGLEPPPFTER